MNRSVLAMGAWSIILVALAPPSRADDTTADLQQQILMQADRVDYDMDAGVVTADGHIELDNSGRILLADQISYNQKSDTVVASGHVSLLDDKGNVAFADHVTLTDRMRNGALESFAALIGKTGRLAAASARRVGGQYTVANEIDYTPCKVCNKPGERTPVWQVHAHRVIYDEVKHRFRFRDATLEFFGVPLLYSPYLTEPDPSVKYASGILTPTVGNSTNIGYFVRVPVYIALSDSNDATIAPLASTHGGELLEGEYRQRWNEGGMWLQASVANNPYGGLSKHESQSYGHAFGSGRFEIDDVWRTGFDLQYSSSDTYMRRYDISQLDRLVDDLFVAGEYGRSRLAITGYYFEGLRATDHARFFPFILPLFQFTFIPEEKIAGGQFRLDLNSADIDRLDGPRSQRITGEVRWRLPLVFGGGQLFTIEADARGDVYHVDNNGLDPVEFPTIPTHSRFIERGLPYLAVDWRWPFVNDLSQGHAIVIEPIAQAIAEPYGGNPVGIPNEDTAAFEFDENNIFSFNQLPGYDLLESGPRVNAGFRAAVIFPSGDVETVWGQTYRFKSDPIFATDSGQHGTVSDIVGRVSVKFLPYVDLTDRIDLDRADGTVRRHEVYLTGTYGRSSLEISFTQLPPEAVSLGLGSREEINAQADVNFYKNWQAFGAIRRDLITGKMLDDELGLGYEDECLGVSVAYRRRFTSDRDLPPSTAIVLRFNLKTGERPIEPFSLFPRDVFTHP
jgi:LPS-assembly protein